jgi:hypothetical protein
VCLPEFNAGLQDPPAANRGVRPVPAGWDPEIKDRSADGHAQIGTCRRAPEVHPGKNGHLDKVINYERTKLLEPPIVLRHLPEAAGKALSEALEASRWGLDLATVALCRLVS